MKSCGFIQRLAPLALLALVLAACGKSSAPGTDGTAASEARPLKPVLIEADAIEIPEKPAPADAAILGYVRVREPRQALDRLGGWASAFQPKMNADVLRQQALAAGFPADQLTTGANVAFFAWTPAEGAMQPPMAGIIPAPLTPQLEQSGAVAVEGGTLAASNPEALATAQAGLPGRGAGQPSPLHPDIEVWLNTEGLVRQFGPMLRTGLQQAMAGVAAATAQQGGDVARMQQLLQGEAEAMLDLFGQMRSMTILVDFGPENLELATIVDARPDTLLAAALQQGAASMPELTRYLSDSPFRIQMNIVDPKPFIDLYMDFIGKMMGPDSAASIERLRAEIADFESLGKMYTSMGIDLDQNSMRAEYVMTADDPDALLKFFREKTGLANDPDVQELYRGFGMQIGVTTSPLTREVDGVTVEQFQMTMKMDTAFAGDSGTSMPFAGMFAGEPIKYEFAKTGPFIVATLGTPIEPLLQRVAQPAGLSAIPAVTGAPPGAVLYGEFDAVAYANFIQAMIKPANPPIEIPGAQPFTLLGYHNQGRAWYRLNIPRSFVEGLATLKPTDGATSPTAPAEPAQAPVAIPN